LTERDLADQEDMRATGGGGGQFRITLAGARILRAFLLEDKNRK